MAGERARAGGRTGRERGDEHADEREDEHGGGGGAAGADPGARTWVPWVLCAASLGTLLVLGEAAHSVLSGEVDEQLLGIPSGDLLTAAQSESLDTARIGALWSAVDGAPGLLVSVLGLAAVAAAGTARRPGWLVPSASARWAAGGLAAATAVAAAAWCSVGLRLAVATLDEEGFWYWGRPGPGVWTVAAVPAGVALLAAVVAGALLRPGPAPAAQEAGTRDAGDADGAAGDGEDAPGPGAADAPAAAADVPASGAAPGGGTGGVGSGLLRAGANGTNGTEVAGHAPPRTAAGSARSPLGDLPKGDPSLYRRPAS
ncbi:hypothetical protein [Kineococcus terrestris]|uniref:hypothetical protein n=1 Tax=Kineococcus terrestris TaxID=2044856 RepID=UPI0034DB64AD